MIGTFRHGNGKSQVLEHRPADTPRALVLLLSFTDLLEAELAELSADITGIPFVDRNSGKSLDLTSALVCPS